MYPLLLFLIQKTAHPNTIGGVMAGNVRTQLRLGRVRDMPLGVRAPFGCWRLPYREV